MKRYLAILGILYFWLLPIDVNAEERLLHYAEVLQEETPIYVQANDQSMIFAKVNQHMELPVIQELDKFYEIKINPQISGYIAKENMGAIYETVRSTFHDSTFQLATQGYMVTNNETPFYTWSHGQWQQAGELQAGVRHPIVEENATTINVAFGQELAVVLKRYVSLDKGIPVLMYHHILKEGENRNYRNVSTTLSVKTFNKQIKWLADQGYQTITLSDLHQYIKGRKILPKNAVVLTFDDGLKSVKRYAYPTLKNYGFNATQFIITSRTTDNPQPFYPDTLQFLSWPELKDMEDVFENNGHTHEMHHFNQSYQSALTTSSNWDVFKDLRKNNQLLGASALSYPFGQYNASIVQMLKQTGFNLGFTIQDGYVHFGDAPYKLNRITVRPSMSFEDFKQKVDRYAD